MSITVQWTVMLKGKQAKKAMKPGGLPPDFRQAAERGLAAIRANPQCGRPLTNDHRWVWEDKGTVPDFRLVYEFDIETAQVDVRYIGYRGSVPY